MNKKYLALLILIVLLIGSYAAVFAYAKAIMIPHQLKMSKEDLNNMNMDLNSYNKTNSSVDFGNVDLSMLPASERKKIADQMRSNSNQRLNSINKLSVDSPITDMFAGFYYLVFEGDAATDMKDMAKYYADVENNSNKFQDLMGTTLPDDIERGDTEAVVADNVRMNELLKENQRLNMVARDQTQKFINDLEN